MRLALLPVGGQNPRIDSTAPVAASVTPEPSKHVLATIQNVMELFDKHVKSPPAHGNESLHLRGMVGILLAAAYEPSVRSLRLIDDLSLLDQVPALSGVPRVARSTLSDAMARFDPAALKPLIDAIQKQLPLLERFDPRTAELTRKIIAGDGSWFNLAGNVVHAMQCRRGNTGRQCRVRLNLQLDVDGFFPTDFDVSGKDDGSEADAFQRKLQPDCIYLWDRNFVNFRFINAILQKGSNFVLRLKKGVNFEVRQTHALIDQDLVHDVRRDEVGVLSGPSDAGNTDARMCTSKPPTCQLRRVTIWDANRQSEVVLLTDLLDVPAHVIGLLYRLRWQIELFFRWLKVLANFRHLISQSEHGITMQFYIAVMMTLLIHLRTGTRVSKYGLLWIEWTASGRATLQAMTEAMARHEKERQNAALRRAKKQAK